MIKEKPIFPQKGTVIIMLKNGIVVAGEGYIDGVKLTTGEYRFTGTLVKDYGKKIRKIK